MKKTFSNMIPPASAFSLPTILTGRTQTSEGSRYLQEEEGGERRLEEGYSGL